MEPTPEMLAEIEMQAAIEEIIKSAEIERPEGEEYATFIRLAYGSKDMEIVFLNIGTTSEYIDNSIETVDGAEKKPRETEALYRAAKKIIQTEIINKVGRSIPFTYDTHNKQMVAFGQNKGRKIFDWDSEKKEQLKDAKGKKKIFWSFKKTFHPES